MKKPVYLDYASATPLDKRVFKAMQPFMQERFANPSSLHRLGREQRASLEAARARVAKVLGAKPAEIIFTSGSTEAANLAVMGVANGFSQGRVVASSVEHEAVLAQLEHLEASGRQTGVIVVDEDGLVRPEQVAAAINDLTVLVCAQYANNEIGTIQPIAKIGAAIAQIRADRQARGINLPLYLYCDAAQAGLLNLQVNRLEVDLLNLGGSKLYGPAGSGVLFVRAGVQLTPVIYGGGQESGLRSGTPNLAAAVGLAEALEIVQKDRAGEGKRQSQLRDGLWKELKKALPDAKLNGGMTNRLPGNLNMVIPGADGETLVAYLDREGFAVATGSACAASNEEPSHVLLAIGRSVPEASSSLRVSLGHQTTATEVKAFAKALIAVVPRVRQLSKKS